MTRKMHGEKTQNLYSIYSVERIRLMTIVLGIAFEIQWGMRWDGMRCLFF